MADVVRSFRIPQQVWVALVARAEGLGCSMNEVVLDCVRDSLRLEVDAVADLLRQVRMFADRVARAGRTPELTRLVFMELRDNRELARAYRAAVAAAPGHDEATRRANVNRRIGRSVGRYSGAGGRRRVRTTDREELVRSFTAPREREPG